MKTLNLQLRFLIPLGLTLFVAAYLALPLLDRLTLRGLSNDLNKHGVAVAEAVAGALDATRVEERGTALPAALERIAMDQRLYALGICTPDGDLLARTTRYPAGLSCQAA